MQLFFQIGDLGPSWFHVSLRTLVLLARADALLKSHIIANILGADPTFIRKILKRLAREGIVSSQGGRNGGYALNRKSGTITVGEVYRMLTKEGGSGMYSTKQTGTEAFISMIVSKAESEFQTILDQYSIHDIEQYAYPSLFENAVGINGPDDQ